MNPKPKVKDIEWDVSPEERKTLLAGMGELDTSVVGDLMDSEECGDAVTLCKGKGLVLELGEGLGTVSLDITCVYAREGSGPTMNHLLKARATMAEDNPNIYLLQWTFCVMGSDADSFEMGKLRTLKSWEEEEEDYDDWSSIVLNRDIFGGIKESPILKTEHLNLAADITYGYKKGQFGKVEEKLPDLKQDEGLCDFALVSKEGKEFPCSKLLLAARSDYFRAMFRHEKHKTEMLIEDCEQGVLNVIHSWIYSGDYGRESAETRDILGALVLADRWLMFDLFSFCEIELVKRVDKSNVVETLDAISNVQRAKRLKRKCLQTQAAGGTQPSKKVMWQQGLK